MTSGVVPPRDPNYAVHKFPFFIEDVVRLQMPEGARILHVDQQTMVGADLCVWAHVRKDAPKVERVLAVYGTGHDMPAEPGVFINTVMFNGGAIVWHVYDAGEVR
jgi:hypothetical protein